jgi:hypothetical protein
MAIADEVTEELGMQRSLAELMRRCQEAGAMRTDIGPEDLQSLFCGLGRRDDARRRPEAWRRYLTLMIDGLRPPASAP